RFPGWPVPQYRGSLWEPGPGSGTGERSGAARARKCPFELFGPLAGICPADRECQYQVLFASTGGDSATHSVLPAAEGDECRQKFECCGSIASAGGPWWLWHPAGAAHHEFEYQRRRQRRLPAVRDASPAAGRAAVPAGAVDAEYQAAVG